MSAPRLRLACCLCRKPIPQSSAAHALDAEWQRRYPQMVGSLACSNCAAGSTFFFRCRNRRDDAYVPGHLPSGGRGEGHCSDSWHHIEAHGTRTALAYSYPWSAAQQGAEDWLRDVVQRPRLNLDVRARIQDALRRRETTAPQQHPRSERNATVQDSIYPVLLDGWDHQSIWGWDSGMSCYFAQLTRNGNSDDNGPDVWITPPAWPAMQMSETLAQAIASSTRIDLATVISALNDSLDDNGKIHRVLTGNRR